MSAPLGTMHHVGVVVRDLDQAEAFLSGCLGLPVVNRVASAELGMRAAFLKCGEGLIELVEFADTQVVQQRLGDREAAIDHIALQVDDLDRAIGALAEHGVATASPEPMSTPAGRMHFTQPGTSAGISWQLLQPPS